MAVSRGVLLVQIWNTYIHRLKYIYRLNVHFTLGGYLTLMSSLACLCSPQWLEILIGVNQTLGILLHL